jgi:glycerophosphoryl diester phosphodiesterase
MSYNYNLYNVIRPVGIYLELKNPSFYHHLNYSMDSLILKDLTSLGYDIINVRSNLDNGYIAPIVIECFEYETLIKLRSKCNLPLIQLVNTINGQKISDLWTEANLDFVKQYANGIGPPIDFFTNFSNIDYFTAKSMVFLL